MIVLHPGRRVSIVTSLGERRAANILRPRLLSGKDSVSLFPHGEELIVDSEGVIYLASALELLAAMEGAK